MLLAKHKQLVALLLTATRENAQKHTKTNKDKRSLVKKEAAHEP